MAARRARRITQAKQVLADLGMPTAQQNERSALCLLALLNLRANQPWSEAQAPLIGITPIMTWMRDNYRKKYAPNTRETIRRQTIHQFVQGTIALYNPDKPDRPINSGDTVYQIEPNCLEVLRAYDSNDYEARLKAFLLQRETLAAQYARQRQMEMVPLQLAEGKKISLSPGEHSKLIRDIVMEFGPRFVPRGRLVYAGDTGEKYAYFDQSLLGSLGVHLDGHGKLPDAVIYDEQRGWLILAEAVTSHGPVNAKRHAELAGLFRTARPGLVYVSAFPDRRMFTRHAEHISWETEVWIADNPTHLIHFNGARYLGPHGK